MTLNNSSLDLIDSKLDLGKTTSITPEFPSLTDSCAARETSQSAEVQAKPNLFIVGAMKSGTTSAFSYLAAFPQVFAPEMKEPQHFSTDLHRHPHSLMTKTVHRFSGIIPVLSRRAYEAMYVHAASESPYRIDSSTSYLYSTEASANISRYNPDAKVVILLRDPVARAWSEYRMNRAIGVESADFATALKRERTRLESGRPFLLKRYTHAGLYGDQVERYLRIFPRDRLFVDVIDRPKQGLDPVLERLAIFLGLPLNIGRVSIRENEARVPANTWVNTTLYYSGVKALLSSMVPREFKRKAKASYYHQAPASTASRFDRELLAPLFQNSNRKLRSLTGLDISHWDGSQ